MAGARKALAVVIALGMSAVAYADDYFKRISMEGVELVGSHYMGQGGHQHVYDSRPLRV